jgi:hypothetical protein
LLGLLGFFCVIRGLTFIGFVCVVKAIRVIITLSEYAKEREAPSES